MANKSVAKVHIETYDEILGGAISGKGGALEIDLSKLHELEKEGDPSEPVTIQHTKVKGGSIETTTVMGKNPQQGGLLEKIFLGEAVDVEAEVIK